MVILSTGHPVEGDGVNAVFFDQLAKENKGLASARVWIASTILFEQGFAKAWYHSEKVTRGEGSEKRRHVEVKKRVGKECNLEAIKETFLKDVKSDGEICAMFISSAPGREATEATAVRFFDRKQLLYFLNAQVQKPKGLLQKFVKPKGQNNAVVQAVWSPTVLLTEARRNRFSLLDRHVSSFKRAATFEGSSEDCMQVVVAPVVIQQIKAQCANIVEHFASTEHLTIVRMVLYFKVDTSNTLRLLYSSSIRIEGSKPHHRLDAIHPLNLAVRLTGDIDPGGNDVAYNLSSEANYRKFRERMDRREKRLLATAPKAADFNDLPVDPHYNFSKASWDRILNNKYNRSEGARSPSPLQQGLRPLALFRLERTRQQQQGKTDDRPHQTATQSPATAQQPLHVPRSSSSHGPASSPPPPNDPPSSSPLEDLTISERRLTQLRQKVHPKPLAKYSHVLPHTDRAVRKYCMEVAQGKPTPKQVEREWDTWLSNQMEVTASLLEQQDADRQKAAAALAAAPAAAKAPASPPSSPPPPTPHKYVYSMQDNLERPQHSYKGLSDKGAEGEEAVSSAERRQLQEVQRREEVRKDKLLFLQQHKEEKSFSPCNTVGMTVLLTHPQFAGTSPPAPKELGSPIPRRPQTASPTLFKQTRDSSSTKAASTSAARRKKTAPVVQDEVIPTTGWVAPQKQYTTAVVHASSTMATEKKEEAVKLLSKSVKSRAADTASDAPPPKSEKEAPPASPTSPLARSTDTQPAQLAPEREEQAVVGTPDLTSPTVIDAPPEAEEQADDFCQNVWQYLQEVVYHIYSYFITHGSMARGATSYYMEPPECFQPVLNADRLNTILRNLHGRVVDAESFCLGDFDLTIDSDDEVPVTQLPWPISPNKNTVPLTLPGRLLSKKQQQEKQGRFQSRRETYMSTVKERVRQRREALLEPSRMGALMRWPPPKTIPIEWEDTTAVCPLLLPLTKAIIIPYNDAMLPVIKGECCDIFEKASLALARGGEIHREAVSHFTRLATAPDDPAGEVAAQGASTQSRGQDERSSPKRHPGSATPDTTTTPLDRKVSYSRPHSKSSRATDMGGGPTLASGWDNGQRALPDRRAWSEKDRPSSAAHSQGSVASGNAPDTSPPPLAPLPSGMGALQAKGQNLCLRCGTCYFCCVCELAAAARGRTVLPLLS
eukprot:Sspe_Gene.60627::Locus_33456_Transcript_1_1_Confidence_1.000_Length_3580::g.60627::m.60627